MTATDQSVDTSMLAGRRSLSSVPHARSIVDHLHEVYNARDWDGYRALLDEHVELVISGSAVHGRAAVTDFMAASAGNRPGLRVGPARIIMETEDTLVTELRMIDATDSGPDAGTFEYAACIIHRVAGGRIVDWRVYVDRAEQTSTAFMALAAEQSALRRVAELVARQTPPERVFALVTEELSRLLGVDLMVRTVRYEPDGTATILAATGMPEDVIPAGANTPRPPGGVLDQVLLTGRPGRVDDYAQIDGPLSVALREGGIRSAAAGPIVVDGRNWGAMAVAAQTALPAGSEHRVAQFAELVSTAISNVESRAKVERLAAEQSALRRVATLVARAYSPDELFATLAQELGVLLEVDAAAILRYDTDGNTTAVAGWSHGPTHIPVGERLPLDGENLASQVWRTGMPQRKDDYVDAAGQIADTVRSLGFHSSVASPIVVEGVTWGVIGVLTRKSQPLPPDTEARMAESSRHAGMAVANAKSRADLAQSRARIVRAADEARRRFERDLHDGAQQRLVSLGLELQAAEATVPPEMDELRRGLSRLRTGLNDVLDDLRELSRGLHPAVLSEDGLIPALSSLALRSAVPVELRLELSGERFAESVEAAAYYVASEALTNTAKHAHASRAQVSASEHDGWLELTVNDDGQGGADASTGSGLTGLMDRVEAIGGTIQIESRRDLGTMIQAKLPIRSTR